MPLKAMPHSPEKRGRSPRAPERRYNVRRMGITWITWQDVVEAPEDGRRYEAIGGALHVTAAPGRRHQWVSGNLFAELRLILHEPGHGELYAAPFGVEFPATGEGAQPDLMFVSRERLDIVGDDWIRGAPDLVIEILSPTTAARDRGLKRKLYQRQGVAEYWIVDPGSESVEVWRFAAGATEAELHTDRVPVHVGDGQLGAIELAKIFERPA